MQRITGWGSRETNPIRFRRSCGLWLVGIAWVGIRSVIPGAIPGRSRLVHLSVSKVGAAARPRPRFQEWLTTTCVTKSTIFTTAADVAAAQAMLARQFGTSEQLCCNLGESGRRDSAQISQRRARRVVLCVPCHHARAFPAPLIHGHGHRRPVARHASRHAVLTSSSRNSMLSARTCRMKSSPCRVCCSSSDRNWDGPVRVDTLNGSRHANMKEPDRLALSQHRPWTVIGSERRSAGLAFLEAWGSKFTLLAGFPGLLSFRPVQIPGIAQTDERVFRGVLTQDARPGSDAILDCVEQRTNTLVTGRRRLSGIKRTAALGNTPVPREARVACLFVGSSAMRWVINMPTLYCPYVQKATIRGIRFAAVIIEIPRLLQTAANPYSGRCRP